MAFDISKFAGTAPVPVSDSDGMVEIPVENIVDNPKNFYPRPDGAAMTALRESIEANGLLEPPTVVSDGGGRYRLISGHSRMAAVRTLWHDDMHRLHRSHRWDTVLCRVLEPMSEDTELTAVIEANRQRVKTPALLADEAERLTAAYIRRQEAGERFPGGIRAAVAAALQVNQTKISNARTIKAGLKVPGIVARWERDELPEAAALDIAKMDIERQYRLLDWVIDNGKPWTIKTVREFAASLDRPEPEPEQPTPTPLPTEMPEGQLVISGWMPGGTTPAEPGTFAVLIRMSDSWLCYHTILFWDGKAWTMRNGERTVREPVYWMRLPPVPEEGD